MQWWTLKQLKSASAKNRLSAAERLGHEGETALVAPLTKLLSDSETDVRAAAALALGRIRSETAVEALAARVSVDSEPAARRAVVKALHQIGSPLAFPALVASLGDPSGEVGWHAAQALKALAWKPKDDSELAAWHLANTHFDDAIALGQAAIGPLVKVAQGTSFHRSIRAVEALAMVGGAATVKPILDCLGSSDFTVRSAAATALGEVGDARALDPLICALRDSHHQVCLAACNSLGKMGDQSAVEPLIQVLNHSAPDVRTAAIESLGRLRDPRAVTPLLECLRDEDNHVREGAALALGSIGEEEAIEQLVIALIDPQTTVRRAAAAALGRIEPHWQRTERAAAAIPVLQTALKSREYWVRHSAAYVLKKLGLSGEEDGPLRTDSDGARKNRFAAQTILFSMLGDRDRVFRQAAAEALGRIGLSDSVSRLVKLLGDSDRGVKIAAARSLEVLRWQTDHLPNKARQFVALERWAKAVALGDPAVEALVEAFTWNDSVARRRATEALVHIGSSKAVAALRALAADSCAAVREEAMAALQALGSSNNRSTRSTG